MRKFLSVALITGLASCGSEPLPPVPGAIITGSWAVTITFTPTSAPNGSWTCSFTSDPTFTVTQTGSNFTGTVENGRGTCTNNVNETAPIDMDGQRIMNGLVEPSSQVLFNIAHFDNILTGVVADDDLSMGGRIEYVVILPPGIAALFVGTWTASKN